MSLRRHIPIYVFCHFAAFFVGAILAGLVTDKVQPSFITGVVCLVSFLVGASLLNSAIFNYAIRARCPNEGCPGFLHLFWRRQYVRYSCRRCGREFDAMGFHEQEREAEGWTVVDKVVGVLAVALLLTAMAVLLWLLL